jgi:hypothetical protein
MALSAGTLEEYAVGNLLSRPSKRTASSAGFNKCPEGEESFDEMCGYLYPVTTIAL